MSVERMYRGNHVLLITGAGTLGTELVKVVNDLDEGYFGEIRILDHSEEALWRLEEQTHPSRLPLKMFLGDIRDEERMRLAMRNVDTVIHTAALKHLRYTNYNPIECLKSNCEAVYKMIELAIELESVKTFINLSTDKACNPDNIYGETKRIGETLSTWGHRVSGKNIYSVRPGNFFGSHGSVFDRWQEQRKSGEIKLTDPAMNRFFIKPRTIAEFIYHSQYGKHHGGLVLVPVMTCLNMGRVAEVLADSWKVKVKVVGSDHGEKVDEELVSYYEAERTKMVTYGDMGDLFVVQSAPAHPHINSGINTALVPASSVEQTRIFLRGIL